MADKPDPLSHTKPLADPVRVIDIFLVVNAILLVFVSVAILVPALGMFGALSSLGLACALFSVVILIGVPRSPNAIYLRAFRTDNATAKLRAELAAILGPDFRLSGIRPPAKKSSTFMRFFLPGLIAFRYAGSKFMELEAGDDWMARLWRTYQSTRLVFIDVRDVTVHVHQEIQMTLETMGTERCLFVVDSSRPDVEWRQSILAVAGPGKDPDRFNLLHADDERTQSGHLLAELTAILKVLPPGLPEATDRGKQFVLGHVSEEQLREGRRISVMAILGAVAAVALSLSIGLLPRGVQAVVLAPLVLVGLVVIVGAVLRTLARIGRLRRAGHRGAAAKSMLLLAVAFLLFLCSLGAQVAAVLPRLINLKQGANEIAAIQSVRTLVMAEDMYQLTYPADGYACGLSQLGGNPQAGQPTAQSAQLIDDLLASGNRSGYTFAISRCTQTTVNGHQMVTGFQITAVPNNPQQGHPRGFCTDETGVVLADPNGGTNCTDALQ
jgi:type IV pilus assembly protein PilA